MDQSISSGNHNYSNLQVGGHAIVHLGNQLTNLVIDSTPVARADYSGHYSYHSLTPVTTFVDRPALRQQIEKQLHEQIADVPSIVQSLVVYGIGGAGKTQLVLDYVHQHRQDYAAVFWVDAGTRESVERDFLQIYNLLYGSQSQVGFEQVKVEDCVPAVKRWFHGKQKKWLFVFDSADNIDDSEDEFFVDLRHYIPDDPSVHVITTTRNASFKDASALQAIEVGEMLQNEAMELFLKQSKMNNVSAIEVKEVSFIVEELGCLALAITLAASYVSTTPRIRADIKQYLPMYRKQQKRLLSRKPKRLIHQYGTSVLTTWETTFYALEKQVPMACTLLTLLGFLHWDDIFTEIFNPATEASESTVRFFPSNSGDEYTIEEIFTLLESYSFLKFQADQNSYSMHKLVNTWARIRLDPEQQDLYSEIAILVLKDRISDMKGLEVESKFRLVPHLLGNFKILCETCQNQQDFESHLPYLHSIIQFSQETGDLFNAGDWKEMVVIEKFVYNMFKGKYGEEDERTLMQLHFLVRFLVNAFELDEALAMATLLVEKCTEILGQHHSDALRAMMDLARVYRAKESLADELSVRVKVFERSKHMESTGETAENALRITMILNEMGKPEEAMLFLKEVVTMHPSQWEMEDPDDLKLIGSLPKQFELAGDVEQAISIQRDLVDYAKRKWGVYHSTTMDMEEYLARLYSSNEQRRDTIKILESVAERRRVALGSRDRLTLQTESELALELICAGETQQARLALPGIIERGKQVWGEKHDLTVIMMKAWDEISD